MKYLVLLLCSLFIFSCDNKEKDKNVKSYYQGGISITTDESFFSVTEALGEAYMIRYPEAKINVSVHKEDQGFIDLLNQKVDVAVMSRELSEKEKSLYESKIDLPYQPAKFAGDAVLFIVPINSPKEYITIDEIKNELNSDERNIIFDGAHASNLNTVAEVFNKKPSDLKFSVIKGNVNLINKLGNYRNKIGAISLNTISRMHSAEAKELRNMIKILPVKTDDEIYDASFQNITTLKYPFTRILYFLTGESYFGMANGFIRFSCTSIGQKVVEKEGLQKYYDYKRDVRIEK